MINLCEENMCEQLKSAKATQYLPIIYLINSVPIMRQHNLNYYYMVICIIHVTSLFIKHVRQSQHH